jgi:hypothetical protein
MSVEVRWHKENLALYVSFSGDITLQDLIDSGTMSMALIGEDNPLPVHQIVDVTTLKSFPTQLGGFGDVASSMSRTHKQSWFVVVGANRMINFVGTVVTQMAHVNCKMVKTLAEAEEFVDHLSNITRFAEVS